MLNKYKIFLLKFLLKIQHIFQEMITSIKKVELNQGLIHLKNV